jgi:hypothetical protein
MQRLAIAVTVAMLSGCAFGAAKFKLESGEQRQPFEGEVLIFEQTVPASVSYRVIGSFHFQNRWYGGVTQEAINAAKSAGAKGANGILVERNGHRMTAYAYGAPYADGKLLWIDNYEQAKQPHLKEAQLPAKQNVERRLAELDELKEKGKVTDKEYAERRAAILGDL